MIGPHVERILSSLLVIHCQQHSNCINKEFLQRIIQSYVMKMEACLREFVKLVAFSGIITHTSSSPAPWPMQETRAVDFKTGCHVMVMGDGLLVW